MEILKNFKFNLLAFIIALSIGLIYTYSTAGEPKIVIKWPTPENTGKVTYIDDNEVCYKYHIKKVKCPADSSKIQELNVQ